LRSRRARRAACRQWFESRSLFGPSQHEDQIGQPVDVAQHLRILQPAGFAQAHNASFRTAQYRAGDVERRRGQRPARNHEGVRKRNPRFKVEGFPLHPAREFGRNGQEVFLQLRVFGGIGRQFSADREELALNPQDDCVPPAVGHLRPGNTQG